MHHAKATILSIFPAIGVLLLIGCERQQPAAPANEGLPPAASNAQALNASSEPLPDWSNTESDAKTLAEPFEMAPYEIRPPADFRFIKHLAAANTYYWIGPVREDETYAQFSVTITEVEPKTYDSLDNALEAVLASIRQRREGWSNAPPEHGKINGVAFIRTSWDGVASSAARKGLAGREMHGIVYLAIQDRRAIQIMCQDVAPGHVETLQRGKSAALTFRVASRPK